MNVTEVVLRHMKMRMKAPFTTSFGTFQDKEFLLLEAKDENGLNGWGESVAFHSPWYNEETLKTNWHMLEDFIIPDLLNKEIRHPDEVSEKLSYIRKNNMAKSAFEGAVWDLYAKQQGIPLAKALGGTASNIEVGISIGIQDTVADLLKLIEEHVNEGYKRIKVKIKPGWDVDVMREVRKHFPDVQLMADANSAYRLEDIELLKQLDEFDLMMIEQPLASDDIIDHATLQRELKTPVCLDESIHSYEDARKAIELGSCRIINIKIGRVGGLTESKKIHDLCQERGIPVWCGGMLESGIGRAHNIALTTLSNFVMPGDTAASSRYWEKDLIEPEVTVDNGMIKVPEKSGLGYEPDLETIKRFTVTEKSYS
ncbi:O-succinylbenzoate synthase [Cytobacillus oceanisediminis]|jgi:O-succinylbenzoate synthase|uniref:o-succinylbenzoate synthase n=1 Tax=Cytobacillus oceanisediminis TaxID=665099 RepID=A0A2V3A5B9_9BACI|nr:o-succinylbenzoate synthase [Cytobacillus oceanisediminis]PWW32213.1 O-succinylbenzoate synthase [Cytobacillus oceanisediminis]